MRLSKFLVQSAIVRAVSTPPRKNVRRSRAQHGAANGAAPKAVGLWPAKSEEVAAYVRVSSASQSAESQRDAISRASAARGEPIGQWHEEQASGAKLARPVLSRLRELIRSGEVRTLYVYRLDRLTRSGITDTLVLLEEIRGAGCVLRTASGELPLDGALGQVLVALLAWVAQTERLLIRERQAAARARLEAQGKSWGRPRRLSTEREQWFAREVRRGQSVKALAQRWGISESTIKRCARRYASKLSPSR